MTSTVVHLAVEGSAARARQAAGLSVAVAAKRARIKPEFLTRLEKHGGFSYVLAARLSALYGCSLDCFLSLNNNSTYQRKGEKTPALEKNVFATALNSA